MDQTDVGWSEPSQNIALICPISAAKRRVEISYPWLCGHWHLAAQHSQRKVYWGPGGVGRVYGVS